MAETHASPGRPSLLSAAAQFVRGLVSPRKQASHGDAEEAAAPADDKSPPAEAEREGRQDEVKGATARAVVEAQAEGASEDEENESYIVEKLVGVRWRKGRQEFLVKWKASFSIARAINFTQFWRLQAKFVPLKFQYCIILHYHVMNASR